MAKRRRRHSSARRHRNPSRRRHGQRGMLNFRAFAAKPMQMITPALIGAVGAVAVNTVISRVFPMLLPVNLQAMFMTGRVRYLTQGAAAIALGMIAQRLGVKASVAAKMAEGSLTVTLADAIRDLSLSMGMPLGGMGYYLPGRGVMAVPSASGRPGVQLNGMNGMNAYVTGPGAYPGSNVTTLRRGQMAGVGGMGFGPGRTF